MDAYETNFEEDHKCYDCSQWTKGSTDGTCKHYIDNTCQWGFNEIEDRKEILNTIAFKENLKQQK